MREIKFRAYPGFMEYNVCVDLEGAYYHNHTSECTTKYDKDIPVMQFTGLRDKNGKEIYERDIIKHTNEEADDSPYIVPEMTIDGMETIIGIADSEWDEGDGQYSNIEVIGNIYEHKHLLEK